MNKKITLKRINHRDSERIAIYFSYDESLKSLVKKVPGVLYSSTWKCFYTSFSEESLGNIRKIFQDAAEICVEWQDGNLKPEEPENSAIAAGKDASPDSITPAKTRKRSVVEMSVKEGTGFLIVRLPIPYSAKWVEEIKSFRGSRYNGMRREWSLPWSKLTADSLADYFSSQGIDLDIKKEVLDENLKLERKRIGDEVRKRPLGEKALEGIEQVAMHLDGSRFSVRTRESYLAMLDFFFRYFSEKDPEEITDVEMSGFICDVIIKLNYSAAYQNQMISAIKTYYTLAGNKDLRFQIPGRPRKARALPKTFSKEEVVRILNSSGNIKHKVLLWLIYSCGLRRSEVTNIKLRDMDRVRSIIHIREGKGRVDRIVPVPDKVWHKVDEYLAGYSPGEYLFEGQRGKRYSSESVYNVFKTALAKAGIMKEVGVHSLRHSFATHLHENGLDIRYIQELLGHKSTRTTEIYTHVSRRNLIAVRSPIEDLDVK